MLEVKTCKAKIECKIIKGQDQQFIETQTALDVLHDKSAL